MTSDWLGSIAWITGQMWGLLPSLLVAVTPWFLIPAFQANRKEEGEAIGFCAQVLMADLREVNLPSWSFERSGGRRGVFCRNRCPESFSVDSWTKHRGSRVGLSFGVGLPAVEGGRFC